MSLFPKKINTHIKAIQNEIITNIDIKKNLQYLVALKKTNHFSKAALLKISKESALRELIKKIELSKYYDIGNVDLNIDNYLQNFYKTLNGLAAVLISAISKK